MKILEDFLEAYCVSLNIDVDKLTSKSRKRELVDSRMIFCAVARKHGGYTLTQIGKLLNTHHATVLHAVRSYDDISTYDSSFRTSYVKARGVFDFCDPRERESVRQRDRRETEKQRNRETEKQRDRETERQRNRDRKTERHTDRQKRLTQTVK